MAISATVYNAVKKKLMDGGIALTSDTIKVALCTSSYVPDIDSHANFSDITHEVTGTGYTAGGATLSGKSTTVDTVNDLAYFDANDASWTGATITARIAVVYKSTGTPSTSPLLCYIDLGVDRSSAGDTFYIQWAAAGIFKIS